MIGLLYIGITKPLPDGIAIWEGLPFAGCLMNAAVAITSEWHRRVECHPFAILRVAQLHMRSVKAQSASASSIEPVADDGSTKAERAGGMDAQLMRPSCQWGEGYACPPLGTANDGVVSDGLSPTLQVNPLPWSIMVVQG